MPYKITSSKGKKQFPSTLKTLLDEIDNDVWRMHANKPESKASRDDVVRETVQILDRYVDQRLILNGSALCDESVNHEKIWAAGDCYMMVAINLTHVLSVTVRFYIGTPDWDTYFSTPLPVDPFTKLLAEHKAAAAAVEDAKALESKLWLQVQNECPHLNMVPRSSHSPGGYLDRAESSYWTECDVCGHTTAARTEYGGFG